MSEFRLQMTDVAAAHRRIGDSIYRTPVLRSAELDSQLAMTLHFKAEHLQTTGSFKVRGALNALAVAMESENPPAGVVTFSAGNHAAAVAFAAHAHGVPAIVCMPENAVAEKVAAARTYGAQVRFVSGDIAQACRELSAETGYLLIEPFDSVPVMAGQATVGVELLRDAPGLDAIIVPVGGGGLIAGISAAVAELSPSTQVIAVEPGAAALVRRSLADGAPARHAQRPDTIADGLSAPFLGAECLEQIHGRISEVVEVDEAELTAAMAGLMQGLHQVVEPSAAAGFAAAHRLRAKLDGAQVGIILSGGNISAEMRARVATELFEQSQDPRS